MKMYETFIGDNIGKLFIKCIDLDKHKSSDPYDGVEYYINDGKGSVWAISYQNKSYDIRDICCDKLSYELINVNITEVNDVAYEELRSVDVIKNRDTDIKSIRESIEPIFLGNCGFPSNSNYTERECMEENLITLGKTCDHPEGSAMFNNIEEQVIKNKK